MAGHSKWSQIKRTKAVVDSKRGALFTRLGREIMVAARAGSDPTGNFQLRTAISKARAAAMPASNIDRAIAKGSGQGGEGAQLEDVRYEGYGPGGIAFIVEALSDNRNRTASEVRSTFSKHGGNLGETGSVNFMFDRVGQIIFPADAADADTMFEAALEAGASDCESDDDGHTITCDPDDFADVRDALAEKFSDPEDAGLVWKPQNTIEVDEDTASTLFKLIEVLEDNDDVQTVASNFEVSDEIMERLSA